MDIQTLINSAVAKFVASLTQNLAPNEAAAVQQIVAGAITLIEASAINRGSPVILAALAGKYPALAAVVSQIPELKAFVGGAQKPANPGPAR